VRNFIDKLFLARPSFFSFSELFAPLSRVAFSNSASTFQYSIGLFLIASSRIMQERERKPHSPATTLFPARSSEKMSLRAIWLSAPAGTMTVSAPAALFFLSFTKLSSCVPTFSMADDEEEGLDAMVFVALATTVEEEEERIVVEVIDDDDESGIRCRFGTELAPLPLGFLACRPAAEQAGRVEHPAAIEGGIVEWSNERERGRR